MRRRLLSAAEVNIEVIDDPSMAPALSVVFASKEDGNLLIVEDGKWNTSVLPRSKFDPIGIVVIPGEHGVLKDGTGTKNQCGVMSLVEMNYDNPERGGHNDAYLWGINWGGDGVDISDRADGLGRYDSISNGLINYRSVVITSSATSNVASGYNNSIYKAGSAYLPCQQSVGSTPTRELDPYAPSPYIGSDYKSGGYNESYGLKDGVVLSSAYNVLSDFKGIVNTKILTDLSTSQSGWKTASTITNSPYEGYYPAACCCARFKTTGTKAFVNCTTTELKQGSGFWYLPSAGELGYISPRFADIADVIERIIRYYNIGNYLLSERAYWTSSENSYDICYILDIGAKGYMRRYNKDIYQLNLVRAFMRL